MRKYDLFPKVSDESFETRTTTGGIITIVTFAFMAIVCLLAFTNREVETTEQHAILNTSALTSDTFTHVYMEVSVAYPCQLLQVSLRDVSGNHAFDSQRKIERQRLDTHLKPLGPLVADTDPKSLMKTCGSCLDPSEPGKCCLTCVDIAAHHKLAGKPVPNMDNAEQCRRDKRTVEDGEACRIVADIGTTFSRGELLISAGGETRMPVHYKHDLTYFGENVNLSHWIQSVRFGPEYAGQVDTLANTKWQQRGRGFYFYHYRLQIVPTTGFNEHGRRVDGYQYSASFSERPILKTVSKKHPGIALAFETSAIAVRIYKRYHPMVRWLTQMLAVMGGGFTIGGLVDSFVFNMQRRKLD